MNDTPDAAAKNQSYDLVVVGSGVAGLTAAQYAARANLRVIVVEPSFIGGQCSNISDLENYPGFPDPIEGLPFAELFERQARGFGAEFLEATVESITQEEREGLPIHFLVQTDDAAQPSLHARAVVLATGAEHRRLDVPGEAELQGRGVSYCATCDGPLFRNQRILVVGGGDAACDEATFLSNLSDQVVLVHRRDRFRAQAALVTRVLSNPHIQVHFNTVVEQIVGGRNHLGIEAVHEVVLRDLQTGDQRREPFAAVFVFVGSTPRTELAGAAERDENGYLRTDRYMQTSVPGLFAVGDVRDTVFRQLVVAAADGAIAAHGASRYIEAHFPAR